MKKEDSNISKCVAIIFALAFVVVGCNTDNFKQQSSSSTYDRVMKDTTIRVGYLPYSVAFIKDPNKNKDDSTRFSGIFHDVLVEAGKNLGCKIEFVEEETFGTMIEAIKTRKVDLVCTAVWSNSQRGKHVDFTTPLYYSVVNAYVKAGNNTFDGNISKINNSSVKISTMDGEMAIAIASRDFPNAVPVPLTQNSDVSQMLTEVSTGKADVTFIDPVVANEFIKNNPNKIKAVQGVSPLRICPNVMIVSKDDNKFTTMINSALEELHNNGFVENIISKYEPVPNSFYRIQKPYQVK